MGWENRHKMNYKALKDHTSAKATQSTFIILLIENVKKFVMLIG